MIIKFIFYRLFIIFKKILYIIFRLFGLLFYIINVPCLDGFDLNHMMRLLINKIISNIKNLFYNCYKFMKNYFHFIEVILIIITFMLCALLG